MIERVLIQKLKGEFATINGCAAWFGFESKGYSISFFEWPQLRDGEIQLTPSTMVVGSVGPVRHALQLLGAAPAAFDFPNSLRCYLGREIHATTMREIRALFSEDMPRAQFVKPREKHKAFGGYVLRAFRDLITTSHQPDDLAVWRSDVVEFISEWRVFVHKHQIIGVGHYRGDPFEHVDAAVVRQAVEDYRVEAPIAYGIDFGVTSDNRTLLVEVNDAYSLGHLGLRPEYYANLLEARWNELMANRNPT